MSRAGIGPLTDTSISAVGDSKVLSAFFLFFAGSLLDGECEGERDALDDKERDPLAILPAKAGGLVVAGREDFFGLSGLLSVWSLGILAASRVDGRVFKK